MLTFARTKIQPPRPRPGALLARPALCARLVDALLERPLVLVCAAAGYGKTSALTQAIDALPAGTALAWLGCDDDDTLLALFGCLVEALEPHDLPWRTAPEALIAAALDAEGPADQPPALRRLAAELINALDAADVPHGIIVVDDLHRVADPAVFAFVDLLLARFTPRWTLAIASRHDPPIALARLRARGEVAEFRADALRFDAGQTLALAAREGVDADAAHALDGRTHGWPAGLRLALDVLRAAPHAPPAANASRVDARAFDFLASEVIDRLPDELREFLLTTSLLPELTAVRCAAMTGDARAADKLAAIERAGLFVTTLPQAETTLRLHDLFRDALAHRLARERPDAMPALLRRAALGERDGARRVAALLNAGAVDDAEAALVDVGEGLVADGAGSQVQALLERFPPGRRDASPALLVLRSQLAWSRWDWAVMVDASALALDANERGGDAARLAQAGSYHAIALAGYGRHGEARALTARLLADARADDATAARALMAECWTELARGDLRTIAPRWSRLMDHLERLAGPVRWYECIPVPPFIGLPAMREPLWRYVRGAERRWPDRPTLPRGMCTVIEGLLHLWAGDVERAQACATLAADDARWLAQPVALASHAGVLQALLWAVGARGDEAQALAARLIDDVLASGDATRRRVYLGLYQFVALRCAATVGDAAGVAHWAERLDAQRGEAGGWISAQHLVGVDALRAAHRGDLVAACAGWRALLAVEHQADLYGQVVEARLRLADALRRQGRPADEAAEVLGPMFERVDADGEWGPVLLAGPAVLARLADDGDVAAHIGPPRARRLQLWAAHAARLALPPALPPDGATPAAAAPWPPVDRAPMAGAAPMGAALVAHAAAPSTQAPTDALTARETEVLARIAAGDSNKAIARDFDLSPHTVKRHVANILDKLALRSRGQAAAWFHAHAAPAGHGPRAGAGPGR